MPEYDSVWADVAGLLESARRSAAHSVNTIMTATYRQIGRRIVEYEQVGRARANYGEALIERLAADLTWRFGRGFGRRNLFQMRTFYLTYPAIVQTASAQSTVRPDPDPTRLPPLRRPRSRKTPGRAASSPVSRCLAWCRRRGVKPRFGAVGRFGSISITERVILTMKEEGLRRTIVPFRLEEMLVECRAFVDGYNASRPHMTLGGATPNEIRRGVRPARDGPRFETRALCPTRRRERLPAKKGTPLRLCVGHYAGRSHLPVIRLRVAA